MGVGVGLRFLHLPTWVIPILVGVSVAAGMILLVRYLQNQPPAPEASKPRVPGPRREARPDPGKRLSGMKRHLQNPSRNGHEE
jgi:hypothetical protein